MLTPIAARARGWSWERLPWPPGAAWTAAALAPVAIGVAVAAHYGKADLWPSLAALAASLLCSLSTRRWLREGGGERAPGRLGLRPSWLSGAGLAAMLVPVVWLTSATAWWLLAAAAGGALGVLALVREGRGPAGPIAGAALGELLVAIGTAWVLVGRPTWLELVAALLPASLAAATVAVARGGARAGGGAPSILKWLLGLALAVPLLATIPGWAGFECFLPWLVAPLCEGPLRRAGASGGGERRIAVRQLTLLLLAGCGLFAVGVWTG